MKSMKLILFASTSALMIALSGCTTGSATRTSAEIYQPTDSSRVEILFERPKRPYKVIGQVSSRGAHLASEDAVYRAMQKEAAELGAHAILVSGAGIEEQQLCGGGDHKRGQALAIRWVDGKASPVPYAVTPTNTDPTTPKQEQIIPPGAGQK